MKLLEPSWVGFVVTPAGVFWKVDHAQGLYLLEASEFAEYVEDLDEAYEPGHLTIAAKGRS